MREIGRSRDSLRAPCEWRQDTIDVAHRLGESLEPGSLDGRDRVGFLGEPIGKHLQGNAALAGVEEFGEESTLSVSQTVRDRLAKRGQSSSVYLWVLHGY